MVARQPPDHQGCGGPEQALQQLDQQRMYAGQTVDGGQQKGIERRHEERRMDAVLAKAHPGEQVAGNVIVGARIERCDAADVLRQQDKDHPQQQP